MNTFLRNYATPISLVAFLAVGVSGLMLFFGIRSRSLSEVHEWVGILFVVAAILHFYCNWQGITAMLSRPAGKAIVGLGTIAVAAILFASFGGGGHEGGRGGHYGPMSPAVSRLAEAPISKLAPALGLTSEEAVARLRRSGVAVEGSGQSLNDIAAKQHAELPRLMGLVLTGPEATEPES